MDFSDNDGSFISVPRWADYLIRFGYFFGSIEKQERRIALVSMPCPSTGAGLIALGCLISDLCKRHASDTIAHEDFIFNYANQYLNFCSKCSLNKCDPSIKMCGFESESNGIIRSVNRRGHLYIVSDKTDFLNKILVLSDKRNADISTTYDKKYTVNLYVDTKPPAVSASFENGLEILVYKGLIEEAEIHQPNLRESYSGLVLAGRALGENDTKSAYESICFRNDAGSYSLAKLLAIYGWAGSTVSRTAFFNTRTERLDYCGTQPAVVVADGDDAFLKSVDTFKKSDVIGVIDRCSGRERLEKVGDKLAALNNWYQVVTEFHGLLPVPVPGISVAIFKKQ